MFGKGHIQKNKFNIMNFDMPVENSLITKYTQPLKEGRHENCYRDHSDVHKRAGSGISERRCQQRALTSSLKIS